jgi:Antirestriction protein
LKESRCNRAEDRKGKLVAFGSEEYSKEELVAEIGSANLMNIAGIETSGTFKNSSAYIQNWLSVLKNDVKFIVSASSKAEKAVRYILNEVEA